MKAREPDPKAERQGKSRRKSKPTNRFRWLILVFLLSVGISAAFSYLSQKLMDAASMFGAFLILFAIIVIGILFDMIGVAVTVADEKPFHSMASKKVPGASEAIRLLRSADKVASICNDIIGDICGIISGAAAALIAVEAFLHVQSIPLTVVQLLLSALVAGLTITGKACCKFIALENCTKIVHITARCIRALQKPFLRK